MKKDKMNIQKKLKTNEQKKEINVGIGFVTGRKLFKNVVTTYIHNWNELSLTKGMGIKHHLFVAYDLKYRNTQVSDYTNVDVNVSDMLEATYYLGERAILNEIESLIGKKVLTRQETKKVFGQGYGMKRNMILYMAIKKKMDYLLFLDDDEYPVACLRTEDGLSWKGQSILQTHLQHIQDADITHGHHCGYISPIPYIEFNEKLTESDFKMFIEAISNDIITWDSIREKMKDGGVTYADPALMEPDACTDVPNINGAKFISGGNLGINLTGSTPVYAFYNPPGARGEDTFLSTCLTHHVVKKVPCYTFHDGFSAYNHILNGVLPAQLEYIEADQDKIINRFYQACIGWVRYKPLLLYVTDPDTYEKKIEQMRENLKQTIPKLCDYFGKKDFVRVLAEFEIYQGRVKKHFDDFQESKRVWAKLMKHLKEEKTVVQNPAM